MNTSRLHLCHALLVFFTMLVAPAISFASLGDCGQPSSDGASPKTSDALCCLRRAVGQECGGDACVMDVNCSHTVTTGDCLLILKKPVGQPVPIECCCEPPKAPRTSARVESLAGSDLDSGWTGIAHNADLIVGASITGRVLRRCTDSGAACEKDAECANHDCKATCDCDTDPSCEVTGPTHQKRCLTTLEPCTTNAQCPVGVSCVFPFGPPLPLSSGGSPVYR